MAVYNNERKFCNNSGGAKTGFQSKKRARALVICGFVGDFGGIFVTEKGVPAVFWEKPQV